MLFSNLPLDVIHYILSYNDTIKYRNGKYMNQICKKDTRYELLLKIPPIKTNPIYKYVYEIMNDYTTCNYMQTYALLCVDIYSDKIIYTFCYDVEVNPQNYHLWYRY